MYCVKCGVRLQDGVKNCPLCNTPVWNPEQPEAEHSYPNHYPSAHKESGRPFAVAMTVVCVMVVAVILTVCFKLYGKLNWGGYAIGASRCSMSSAFCQTGSGIPQSRSLFQSTMRLPRCLYCSSA